MSNRLAFCRVFPSRTTLVLALTLALPLRAVLSQDDETVERSTPAVNEAAAEGDDAAASSELLRVRVRDAHGESVTSAYVTLWRALGVDEHAPVSRVSGPAAAAGIDYYTTFVWHDSTNDTRWLRERSAHPNDGRHRKGETEFRFAELQAGQYRVTAVSYRPQPDAPDPTPYGLSAPFLLDGRSSRSIEVRWIDGDAALELQVTDEVGRPIPRMALRLHDATGVPIVHGHGSGNFFERTDDTGRVLFRRLPAGSYRIEIMGKSAAANDFIEYPPLADGSSVTVNHDETSIEFAVPGRQLDRAEIDRRFPFSIFGRVTDLEGNPLAGVEVRAATGEGTLLGGGRVKTDAEGRYRLYFTPGLHTTISSSAPLGVGVQAAHFYATRDGWELSSADGYYFYLMTDNRPEHMELLIKRDGKIWGKSSIDEVVFAHEPREINFKLRRTQ